MRATHTLAHGHGEGNFRAATGSYGRGTRDRLGASAALEPLDRQIAHLQGIAAHVFNFEFMFDLLPNRDTAKIITGFVDFHLAAGSRRQA